MSSTGRALRRSSRAQIGPNLLPDIEEAGGDLHPDAAEPSDGKQGVMLEDLLRAQPSVVKPDLEWAPPGTESALGLNYDDIDLASRASDPKVDGWPAADPPSLTSQDASDELSQAAEVATAPTEDANVNAAAATAARWPAWALRRSRLLALVGVATIGLAVTGAVIALSGRPGTAPSPASGPRSKVEQAPPVRPAPSEIEARTPSAEANPNVEPAAAPAAVPGKAKRGVRAVPRTRVGVPKHKKKKLASLSAKQRASASGPRSPTQLSRGIRTPDAARDMGVGPKHGALALYNEGTRLQKIGDRDAAISAYVRALAEDPSLIEAHNNLAVLRMHSGDAIGAEQSLQAAMKLNSRYGPAYANLGRLYIQQRRTEEAESMLLRAASLMPANASVRNNLALLYQQLGRDEDEANAWRSALALGSEDAAVHYNLGMHYQGLGESALARTHFEKALAKKDRLSAPYRESARRELENLNRR